MIEYQLWAVDRAGQLLHCGPHKFERIGPSAIRRYIAEWEAWADTIAKKSPGCPTASSRRRTVKVAAHPIGKPEQTTWYTLRTP